VSYRNRVIGHGAAGLGAAADYDKVGRALLAGLGEVFGPLDVLAGRKLLYLVIEYSSAGRWRMGRYELVGESARRVGSRDLPHADALALPYAEGVYLESPAGLQPLHPLVRFDLESHEVWFLNGRRGRRQAEYLCYTSNGHSIDADLGDERRALLVAALKLGGESAGPAPALPAGAAEAAPGGPKRLGEFELLGELGSGGMGVVHRAWQPSLRREVAVKCLRPAGGRSKARFLREIRALGKVKHPNLVDVFASGSDGDELFYVMELVEGAPLSAVCERLQAHAGGVDLTTWQRAVSTVCEETPHPKPPADPAPPPPAAPKPDRAYVRHVVGLMRQAAEAAHALHQARVVHRDVKPGNVMVTADGTRAVLVDLGLARMDDDACGTLTEEFVGTLRYASPEQVFSSKDLDRRTDVYSLGATLWELLALRPLFGQAASKLKLKGWIQRERPERLQRLLPELPRVCDLDAVVQKCLEKEPEHRYATARELADDLRRWLDDEEVRARPVTRMVRWWRRCRRNRWAVLVAAGLGLVLLAGAAAATVLVIDARDRERQAQKRLRDQEESKAADDAKIHEAIDKAVEQNPNLRSVFDKTLWKNHARQPPAVPPRPAGYVEETPSWKSP
jgi:serine/threonine protein kinase